MVEALLNEVPTKKPKVSVVMDEELKAALESWADKESRTVSNLCEIVLRKAATEAGHLQDESQN
jgi:hypothetical protein